MSTQDPGLQPQRTTLAWNRTAMAMGVNALLVLRAGLQPVDASLLVLGFLLAVIAGALVAGGHWRRLHMGRSDAPTAPPGELMLFTAGAVFVAACSGVWVMLR